MFLRCLRNDLICFLISKRKNTKNFALWWLNLVATLCCSVSEEVGGLLHRFFKKIENRWIERQFTHVFRGKREKKLNRGFHIPNLFFVRLKSQQNQN